MTKVTVTVELEADDYGSLLSAANESRTSVSEFVNGLLKNYLEDNYGQV